MGSFAEAQDTNGVPEKPGDDGRISLADAAYAQLRRQILEVELLPGVTFSEHEIVERLELGKTPVREALLRLRLEGLVEVRPRAGYEVAPVTLKAARGSLALRGALDAEAAAQACVQPGAAKALVDLNRHLLAEVGTTVGQRVAADQRFHLALASASGNQALVDAVDRCFTDYVRFAHLATAIDGASLPPAPDHTQLVEAVAGGDTESAQASVRAEAREAELQIVQTLIMSDSVATANVLPTASANKFYLDTPKSNPR